MYDVICKDADGNIITHLTQWDMGQSLVIKDTGLTVAPFFHFYNQNSTEALVVTSTLENDTITVAVPNILLQEGMPIIACLYSYSSNTSGKTLATVKIPVRPRPKPSEYKYVENIDVISVELFKNEIQEKLDNLDALEDSLTELQVKVSETFDDEGNIAGGKLKNCAKVVSEFPNNAQSPADFTGQLCLNQPAREVYICEAVGTDGTGYFLRLATAPELEKYLKKTDYADYDTPGAVKLATDTIYEAGVEQPRAISEGYLSGSLRDYLKTEDLGKKIHQKYFYINQDGKLDAVAPDFDSTTGFYIGGLVRADDMTDVLRATLISDMFGGGMKDADKTIACNNIGAARPGEVEVAIEEYLGKNNYITQQEVPGALTAGKYIDISADGKITAKSLNNYGSYSDMTDFSDSVLLTPQDMPEMMAITITSGNFQMFMTDARKDAALQILGAAKESDVTYASQTAKGTIRAWVTTEDGESVLNLATEDEADET